MTKSSRMGGSASWPAYPSACKSHSLAIMAWEIHTRLLRKLRPEAIGADEVTRLAPSIVSLVIRLPRAQKQSAPSSTVS